jgi:polyhydroxyalkanoate synthesis regulator phasin
LFLPRRIRDLIGKVEVSEKGVEVLRIEVEVLRKKVELLL